MNSLAERWSVVHEIGAWMVVAWVREGGMVGERVWGRRLGS